jgi:PAS domain S-box-containing protein
MDSRDARTVLAGVANDPERVRFDLRRDLVATMDESGRFTSLNLAWERALGWTREQLMAMRLRELVHPDDVEPTLRTIRRLGERDLEVVAFENRFRRKDGDWAWLLWHARTDGSMWIGIGLDVTAERVAEERIASAIADHRLLVYAQPIVDRRSGRTVQEELLVRMREDGEVLEPRSFLPEAERTGAVARIDRWMVDRAFELAAGGRRVAVNLSPRTVANAALMQELAELIGERAGQECMVSFELTETAALANLPAAHELGKRLEGLACELALDDFGTGSASFLHLRELPIDTIKIDRSFVAGLDTSEADRAVCRAIAGVARELGLTTVAEGVEDERTLARVEALDVDRVQGFLFGSPVPT